MIFSCAREGVHESDTSLSFAQGGHGRRGGWHLLFLRGSLFLLHTCLSLSFPTGFSDESNVWLLESLLSGVAVQTPGKPSGIRSRQEAREDGRRGQCPGAAGLPSGARQVCISVNVCPSSKLRAAGRSLGQLCDHPLTSWGKLLSSFVT